MEKRKSKIIKIDNDSERGFDLYITSDEEIKDGDWVLYDVEGYNNPEYDSHFLGKVTNTEEAGQSNSHYIVDGGKRHGDNCSWHCSDCKKIIATTDYELRGCKQIDICSTSLSEKCICPDRLPQPSQAFIKKYCKLDGIDEVDVEYERDMESMQLNVDSKGKISSWYLKVNSSNEIAIHSIKDSWSREEVISLARDAFDDSCKYLSFKEWIRENL